MKRYAPVLLIGYNPTGEKLHEIENGDYVKFADHESAVSAAVRLRTEECAKIAEFMPCGDTGDFGDGHSAARNEIETTIRALPRAGPDVLAVIRDTIPVFENAVGVWNTLMQAVDAETSESGKTPSVVMTVKEIEQMRAALSALRSLIGASR